MLQRFIREGSKSCRCPVDFFAMPMIVAAASVIGASRCLQIHDDWHVFPGMYVAIVGEPGWRKSPALSKVMRPVKRLHKLNLDDFKREQSIWRGMNPASRGAAPVFKRTYTTDSTGEKLAGILQECVRGFMLFKDELTGWIRGMDQYKSGGKGTERQMYLSCWSNEPFSVERKSNEDGIPVTVQHPVLSVLGGIQPDMLPLLADSKGRADGFMDRILFCYPSKVRLPWTWDGISPQARNAWKDIIDVLWKLQMNETADDMQAMPILLSDGAKEAWVLWQHEHDLEQDVETFNPMLRGAWAKMDTQLARIALVLHLIRLADLAQLNPDSVFDLDQEAILGAALVVDYLKEHIKRSLGILEVGQEERQVEKAAEWIRKRGGKCTLREAYTNHIGGVKKASDAQKLFTLMADYGLGKIESVKAENDKTVLVFILREI